MLTITRITLILCFLLTCRSEAQKQVRTNDREGYVISGGIKIWYRVEGTGEPGSLPLIFIHGGPGATDRPFEKTIGPDIAKVRQALYVDYRGCGRSERPKDANKYSFAILADDMEAVRKELAIERWSVFGHSNGAATAITYALKYPKRVASLILCSPLLSPADLEMNMIHKVVLAPSNQYEQARTIYKSSEGEEARFGKLLELMDAKTRYGFQYYNLENSAKLEKIQSDLAKEIGKGLMEPALIQGLISNGFFQFDAFKSAHDLKMPVLVLLGRYDGEISLDNAMKFALTVPDGYVCILNKSGHHPYLEETEGSEQEITEFLSRHSRGVTLDK